MSYELDGFLSPEAGGWIEQHRQQYFAWFNLAEEFNRAGHLLVEGVSIDVNVGRQVIGAALYARTLEFFQSVVLMAERGMPNQAKTVLRSQIEATFSLRAVTMHEDVMQEYVAADALQRLKGLKKIRNNETAFRSVLANGNGDQLDALIREVEEEVRQKKPKKLEAWYLAEKGGMRDFYDTAYVFFSSTVHSAVRDLEYYLEIDDEQNISGMLWGPQPEKTDRLLASAIETLVFAFQAMEETFGLSSDVRKPLLDKFHELGDALEKSAEVSDD